MELIINYIIFFINIKSCVFCHQLKQKITDAVIAKLKLKYKYESK